LYIYKQLSKGGVKRSDLQGFKRRMICRLCTGSGRGVHSSNTPPSSSKNDESEDRENEDNGYINHYAKTDDLEHSKAKPQLILKPQNLQIFFAVIAF
jgi:hypothetical protein